MKAFVLQAPGRALLIDDAPCAVLEEPYGAVLEPVVVSPCSSDVNTVYGSGSKKPDNLILGHECIARVKAVASRVRDFQVGDLVAVPAITPDCGMSKFRRGTIATRGAPSRGMRSGGAFRGYLPRNLRLRMPIRPLQSCRRACASRTR